MGLKIENFTDNSEGGAVAFKSCLSGIFRSAVQNASDAQKPRAWLFQSEHYSFVHCA